MTHTPLPYRLALLALVAAIAACGSAQPQQQTTVAPTAPPPTAVAPAVEAAPTAASDLPLDPAVTHGRLDNGISYYIRQHGEPQQRAELRLVINAGSVLEDDDQQGLAHFVEHMCFNGTENFEKQELVDYLESIGLRFGADLNAYTSFDQTVYMLQVPTDDPELVVKGIQILAEWAHKVSFADEEIDKERGVVIEEWRQGRGAQMRMFDEQMPIIYQGSRYAERLPIGKKEILETAAYDTLRRYYRDWYRPDLMAVVAVGDFEPEDIRELIQANFSVIPAAVNPRPRQEFSVPDHDETLYAIATDPEATMTRIGLLQKLPKQELRSEADWRRSLVEDLYDAMLNQRLQERTREADPPFLFAYSSKGSMVREKGAYSLGAFVQEDGLERGLKAVMVEAERVRRFGFNETELDREKRAMLRAMDQAHRERDKIKSRAYAGEYAAHYLTGVAAPGLDVELELAEKYLPGITLDEVNGLAERWLSDRSRVITVNAPQKDSVEVPREASITAVLASVETADITAYDDRVVDRPLLAAVPPAVDIVETGTIEDLEITDWRLANGVRVVLKPTDFKNDEILFTAFSPGGHSLVGDDDYIAATTADSVVLQGGLDEFDLNQLQKLLADKVVSVRPYISELEEGLSGSASPEDVELMFQLIHLYFTSPRRSENAFASVQQRQRGFIENRLARPEAVFWDKVTTILSQDHFRRRPWTVTSLDEMNLDTSFEVYSDRFADASDFTFVFVGNFTLDEMQPLVRSYLGNLPSTGREESWRDIGVTAPEGVIEETVEMGLEPKSQVAIFFQGDFDWNRQNRFDLRSLVSVMRIRMREVLREDESGTYGVGVRASPSRVPRERYRVTITFGCDPARVDELVGLVYDEIRTIQAEGPDPEIIEKFQQQERRRLEVQLRENGFWLSNIESSLWHGEDLSNILTYQELLDELDTSAVQESAQRWIDFDNRVQVVLVPEGA